MLTSSTKSDGVNGIKPSTPGRTLRAQLSDRLRAVRSQLAGLVGTRMFQRGNDAVARRRAVTVLVATMRGQTPKDQVRTLVHCLTEGLQHLERESVYPACAGLTDLVRIHPRMQDPASFGLVPGDARPVVVGPWLMEVGFELLYWIPYLRAELSKFGISKERVIAISRGGAEPWYGDIAGRYLDVLDYMTAEEFHAWTSGVGELEGNRKPFSAGPFEREILGRVLFPDKLGDYQVVMPSAIFGLMRNVWRSRFGAHKLDQYLKPALLNAPSPIELPFDGPYTAVKFYHSLTFPETAETNALAGKVIEKLARRTNVVLLSNPGRLDDHETLNLTAAGRHNVIDAGKLYSPRNNLAVQTALVSGAQSLHCTYGGFSYLGPLLGVDTCAYTSTWAFNFTHLELAWRSFAAIGAGQLAMTPLGGAMFLPEDGEADRHAQAAAESA